MLKRLYHWMIRAAESPYAVWILAAVSFAESSFFPIAPDLMLVPIAVAKPNRAFFYAFVCGAASVLGGIAGYGIGYFLFASVGQPILNFYGYEEQFLRFAQDYNQHGFWWVFASGLTPLPYKIFTIASGVTHLDLGVFIGASCASRFLRYFVEAAAIWKFGDRVHAFIENRVELVLSVAAACLIGGFFLLKYVF